MAHVGDDGQGHPHDPEEVRVEDLLGLLDRAFLRTTDRDVEAGVIHQQIEAPSALNDCSDCCFDGFVTGDVQRQHLN